MSKFKRGKLIESVNIEVLDNDKTLQILIDEEIQSLDPNGVNRNIILPNETISKGFSYKIFNKGISGNLVICNSNSIPIITLTPATMGIFVCDGNLWKASSGTGGGGGSSDASSGDIESMMLFYTMGGF